MLNKECGEFGSVDAAICVSSLPNSAFRISHSKPVSLPDYYIIHVQKEKQLFYKPGAYANGARYI